MPISLMELPVFKSYTSAYRICFPSHCRSTRVYTSFFGPRRYGRIRLSCKSKSVLRISMSTEKEASSLDGYGNTQEKMEAESLSGQCGVVDVIGIGSRKDALLEFCLDSPFQFSSLRFWNILVNDKSNVQLQQRLFGKDLRPRTVDADVYLQSLPKAIILVSGAGYGLDHIAIVDILRSMRSTNGFAVAIILKPFSFEGQRRLDEVKDLVAKLQEHTDLFIDIDTDTLLKKELVTLDQALKTANNAALLAINAVSVLVSGMHMKRIDALHNNGKELKVSEVLNILKRYKEAKIGFGAGYKFRTSLSQAINCPFIGAGVKDLDGMVLCVIASSSVINNNDIQDFLHIFRQTTEYRREIIMSIVHEPNLEPNLLVTTVVIMGCIGEQASQKSSILSRLAQHFPFVSNLLRRQQQQSNDTYSNAEFENICPTNSSKEENRIGLKDTSEDFDDFSGETLGVSSKSDIYSSSFKNQSNESEENEAAQLDGRTDLSSFYDDIAEGNLTFQRETLSSWNLGLGHQIAQEWAKERADDHGPNPVLDNLSIFCLPVGVRPSEELKDGFNSLYATEHPEPKSEDKVKVQALSMSNLAPWGALTDVGFEVVRDIYNTASALLKGKDDVPKKQGLLSVRAASMLEAEQESPKKWSPIVEMQYRGGVYKGRCQGGLPEGKGRLLLGDGSIYDGTWHYGKRSGLGTFYFSNGDVFQGSWRDDLIHGKGWFYFHTGDRWFANFWKGKANGEGRFYSRSGDVFFGHFEDGWRHGHFLCINVDGERYSEIWDQGVIVSRQQLDTDDIPSV